MSGPRDSDNNDNYDPRDERTDDDREFEEEVKNLEDEWYKEDAE